MRKNLQEMNGYGTFNFKRKRDCQENRSGGPGIYMKEESFTYPRLDSKKRVSHIPVWRARSTHSWMYVRCVRIDIYIELVKYPPQGSFFYEHGKHNMWEENRPGLSCLPNNACVFSWEILMHALEGGQILASKMR